MSGPRRAWLRTMHRRHIRRVVLGAGGSGFSPTNVAGLTLWLDANVGLFQTTAAGTASGDTDPVGTWVDQSPSGNRASQGTGASKPSLQLDAGHASGVGPYVLFDGLNDTLAVFDTLTAGTVFAVIFHSGPVAQERVIDADDTGGWSIQLNNVTQHYEVVGITVASDFRVNGALSVVAQVPALATTRVLTAKVTTPALLAVALASKVTALGTDPFHGGLREILVYTGRLADSDRVAIENYLFLKWMPVAAGFTGTTSGFAGGTFSFIDASEYAVSWSWEKNDGSGWVPFADTPTAQSPNETLAAGTWSIRQTVTGHGGDVNTFTRANYVSVSAFTPAQYSPLLWYAGSNVNYQDAGVTPASALNDPVGRFTDASGNNHHLDQSTSGNKPVLVPGAINGNPAVRFDGSNDYLRTGTFTWNSPTTVFLVYKVRTSGVNSYFFDGGSSNSLAASERPTANDFTMITGGSEGPTASPGLGNWAIACGIYGYNGGSDKQLRLNDGTVLTTASGVGNTNGLVMGTYFGADALFSAIDVAEMIVFQEGFDVTKEATVRDWLNAKYAIYTAAGTVFLSLLSGGVFATLAGTLLTLGA